MQELPLLHASTDRVRMVAIVVGFCFCLIFFFVPETFWDRAPTPRGRTAARSKSPGSLHHHLHLPSLHKKSDHGFDKVKKEEDDFSVPQTPLSPAELPRRPPKSARVGFAVDADRDASPPRRPAASPSGIATPTSAVSRHDYFASALPGEPTQLQNPAGQDATVPRISTSGLAKSDPSEEEKHLATTPDCATLQHHSASSEVSLDQPSIHYTDYYREAPPKSYIESLKPWNGRLAKKDKWHRVMIRPFILFAYPAVLWSSMVYALAVGWLIVISESIAHIYENRSTYNFTPLQVGLVYISPFIGGVLGTAVAGKFSDIIVRFMARKNDGVYEPEFRLVMALPIAISTTIGLMGFGWSAEEKDAWIVPTVFFGIISFGCSLASTTAVTFVVDSYRVYAGEALVTLNVCKNILHGFIFSLFFTRWLEAKGPKDVFLAVGSIQLGCMLLSVPMYVFGKRARMWTVRKNFMEKF
jgi:hypothetical protein